jgi:hypothetical protein
MRKSLGKAKSRAMSFFQSFIVFIGVVSAQSLMASDGLSGKSLKLEYADEQHYTVEFSAEKVTWECVKGDERGRSETDVYQMMPIAKDIYLVNWTESDGSYVDLVLNLDAMKVFSSGIVKDYKWFPKGNIVNR